MTLVAVDSPDSVAVAMDRLLAALKRRGINTFARVDHGAGARAAGLELADEELLIFGDPRVGTLLMQSDPEIGYELPLRVLCWDAGGQTKLGYRRPSELAERYALSARKELLARMDALLEELLAESTAAS
jgi:beta-galactosidase